MIYLGDGDTGSGKSHYFARLIRKRWLKGENIYSKIELNFFPTTYHRKQIKDLPNGYTVYDYPKLFKPREKIIYIIKCILGFIFRVKVKVLSRGAIYYFNELEELSGIKNGVIFFDDAGDILDAYSWDKINAEFRFKLQKHRHQNLDLYATIPNFKQIDVNYRRLVHHWIHSKKIISIPFGEREFFGIHKVCYMDKDKMHTPNINLEEVPIKKIRYYFIKLWGKRLYYSENDIPYIRDKLLWELYIDLNRSQRKEKIKLYPRHPTFKKGSAHV